MANLFSLKKPLIQKDAGGAYADKQCWKLRLFVFKTETHIFLNTWVISIMDFLQNLFFPLFKVCYLNIVVKLIFPLNLTFKHYHPRFYKQY